VVSAIGLSRYWHDLWFFFDGGDQVSKRFLLKSQACLLIELGGADPAGIKVEIGRCFGVVREDPARLCSNSGERRPGGRTAHVFEKTIPDFLHNDGEEDYNKNDPEGENWIHKVMV
jgi:hypothetical protein